MKNKHVLITGGLGFIGSNLAHACRKKGARVTIYDCLDPHSGGNMENIAGIKSSVELVVNDIRHFDGLSAVVQDKDIIFHCAAYTSHPNSMKEPWIDIDVNCTGTINLLEAARRFNPDARIIHVGTSTQIGKMRSSPIDENHPEFPSDIYSANKMASEKYALIYGQSYKMKTAVIRCPNVFGPRSNIKTSDSGFINYFIGLAAQGRELTVYGTGKQLRNLCYVEDVVSALMLAAQSEKCWGETLFAVGDRQYQIDAIAKNIVKAFKKGSVGHVAWPPEREAIEIGDAVISNKKIKKLLGWSPKWNLEDGLRATRSYLLPRLAAYLR